LGAALSAVMVASPAFADWQSQDWYVSLGAGISWADDMDTKNVINPAADEELSYDTGWTVVGAVGDANWRFFRTELEVGYRTVDADQLSDGTNVFGPFNMDGSADLWNVGVNGYYDFQMESVITPYVGLGAGVAHFDVDVHRSGMPAANKWDGDDWGFYYQGIVGASMDVGEQHQVFVEYRYFGTMGINAESNNGAFTPDSNEDEFRSHTIMGGIRIAF
jgi:opacity protein-like surface antigen